MPSAEAAAGTMDAFGGEALLDDPTAPLERASAAEVREARHANPDSAWAARSFEANRADPTLACHRVWTALPTLGIRPKFRISSAAPVFAMGSCFAREVEEALVTLGFDVPTCCDPLFDHPLLASTSASASGARPRAYLNRYNAMSLADEIAHLLGRDPDIERGLLSYPLDRGGCADLHYSQTLPQRGQPIVIERRRRVREHFATRIADCRVFIFTLGLAECWFDRKAGRYLNNTPGPHVMAAYDDRLEVRLTRFSEQLAALERTHAMLDDALDGRFEIVITVSPVPLERTFLHQDVVSTNCYSKSMLRAVAQEFAAAHANVDYFPSYEFVMHALPRLSWAWDFRHVKPELVAHIMQRFREHYVREP